ncbi:MAG: PEP-CTERM sorting domain-containing protein [Phycisphaerales bacterium]
MRFSLAVSSAVFVAGVSASSAMAANFGTILNFNPLTDPVAGTFGVDMNNTQTWTGTQLKDIFGNPAPTVRWFKYTADGNSAVTFDTNGTNISSVGPDPDRSPGNFLQAGNATQLALYDSAGNLVARMGGTKDLNGELVPEFPSALYDSNDPNYHLRSSSIQLADLMFMQNAPDNPHWDTSPGGISDPLSTTDYEGLHIDCFECSGQKYTDGRNEYEVWRDSLDLVENQGASFFRSGDRYNAGPGSSWNRYDILPAGDYYLALTGAGPSFSGDTYKEEWMMTPIHDGFDRTNPLNPIFIENVPLISSPMGPFQMYVGEANPNFQSAWGDIQLNITHYALTLDGDLNGDGFVGIADLNIVLGNWNQNVTPGDPLVGDPSGDGFVGINDLNLVLGNWNAGTPPSAPGSAVPEPATLALLSLGGLATLRRRR